MIYAAPKVTIDLDEYNDLQSWKEAKVGDEYVEMAKTVVAVVVNNMKTPHRISEILKDKGIHFSIHSNGMAEEISSKNVLIAFIKEEKSKQ